MCQPGSTLQDNLQDDKQDYVQSSDSKSPRYIIFLLTVWFEGTSVENEPISWRFRLENPRTKESRGFVGIKALLDGLLEMIRNR